MATSIISRNWKCFCGYHQIGTMSYYKWRKMYSAHYQTEQSHIDKIAEYRAAYNLVESK